jgi:predicted DNA-binding protein (UPF0251 family)
MSPRSKAPRKVSEIPLIKGYKPYGGKGNKKPVGIVNLLLEEYEALKLSDYEHRNHKDAALEMGVSRPTFTRIYAAGLAKLAEAFVEGKGIVIEGGHVYFDSDWYFCKKCNCRFNNPGKITEPDYCPLCGAGTILSMKPLSSEGIPDKLLNQVQFVCGICGNIQEVDIDSISDDLKCDKCQDYLDYNQRP